MFYKANEIPLVVDEEPMGGKGKIAIDKMSLLGCLSEKINLFAKASLEPGAEVGYHVHTGDDEAYYFLSGVGEYNDNGNIVSVGAGDFTYTPDGEGHGLKNIGDTPLEFIALITNTNS